MPDFDVQHNGMDLYRKEDWDTNNTCATMDLEWTQKALQTWVREHPKEALEEMLNVYGYRGLQHEFNQLIHMVENVHVAHLVAVNATAGSAAENDPETKGAVQRWIREHWTPLFDQIRSVREGVNWQEQIDRLDGFTVAGTKAALDFFDALCPDLTQ